MSSRSLVFRLRSLDKTVVWLEDSTSSPIIINDCELTEERSADKSGDVGIGECSFRRLLETDNRIFQQEASKLNVCPAPVTNINAAASNFNKLFEYEVVQFCSHTFQEAQRLPRVPNRGLQVRTLQHTEVLAFQNCRG